MKPYRVQIEVTSTYIVEVHAEDENDADSRAWNLDIDEVQAQATGPPVDEVRVVGDIEEIQRETEDE